MLKEILFDNIKIKVVIDNIGITVVNPLKYLITLEWCLLYKTPEDINNPELIRPWAIIIVIEANNPSIEWVNIVNVTKPIWDIEE